MRDRARRMNGGLAMNVMEVSEHHVLCEHLEGPEMIHKQTWVDKSQVEVIIYGNGGFKNPGK